MTVVVDDHVLMACLALAEPAVARQARRRGRLFTSGLWYHRLCRALNRPGATGRLSARLVGLPPSEGSRLLANCRYLPDAVRMISLREVGWPMGELVREHRLNLMHLEALAAARLLGATICVWEGDRSPQLEAAAERTGVPLVAVPL